GRGWGMGCDGNGEVGSRRGPVGAGGTQHDESRQGAEADELLDGFMRWTVFAQADGIVGEDIDDWNFHERGEAHGWASVVAEDQERGAKRADFAQHHSIQNGTHSVFADAEVEIPSFVVAGFEVAGAVEREPRLSRGRKIGCAADQPRYLLGQSIQDFGSR